MNDAPLSIVIPALNAADSLPATLAALREGQRSGLVCEIILVDAGSGDSTLAIATREGLTVISMKEPGRGRQLAEGAAQASAPWLLFVHADTILAPGWSAVVADFIAHDTAKETAGYFSLELDDSAPQARRIERLANWRARRLKLPYGDQGLLIHRSLYDAKGGFRPLPLMEDVDFARRLGRDHLVLLAGQARTSAVRYRRDGWWTRPLRNLAVLTLYYLGLPPTWLRRLYG